ncbi:hypothetical protein T458_01655 [Brevibacillus panacihumi W25]|uniref:Uncharacterized protein n=1 Tax=Brevibacillus panacihumi W25 TaxID=1408254 RepID=V6MES2_9BACL|nr:hypothetical protein T458_01655 [Brevibacillus panacihumi W25]
MLSSPFQGAEGGNLFPAPLLEREVGGENNKKTQEKTWIGCVFIPSLLFSSLLNLTHLYSALLYSQPANCYSYRIKQLICLPLLCERLRLLKTHLLK